MTYNQLTRAQSRAVVRLFERDLTDDHYYLGPQARRSKTYGSFLRFRRVVFKSPGGYAGIWLWDMFVGIEEDGYTHT